ncbi:MAG: DUF2922 domain-containing protein [Defluviitaleaceae bacterium]|nr:DUF2922 domain-containing protein [Defluviitaleaceae bacterium]
MRETAELIFSTSEGRTRVIRVPEPMAVIPTHVYNLVISDIITANPFDETVGNLQSLKRADRVAVNRTQLI